MNSNAVRLRPFLQEEADGGGEAQRSKANLNP